MNWFEMRKDNLLELLIWRQTMGKCLNITKYHTE